jgi:hypothetical protein
VRRRAALVAEAVDQRGRRDRSLDPRAHGVEPHALQQRVGGGGVGCRRGEHRQIAHRQRGRRQPMPEAPTVTGATELRSMICSGSSVPASICAATSISSGTTPMPRRAARGGVTREHRLARVQIRDAHRHLRPAAATASSAASARVANERERPGERRGERRVDARSPRASPRSCARTSPRRVDDARPALSTRDAPSSMFSPPRRRDGRRADDRRPGDAVVTRW